MKIEWIVLADGVGQDTRGALTAIALSQNVIPTSSLPTVTKRAVIVHMVEEPGALKSGDTFSVTFNVLNPSGKVISAHSGQVAVVQVPWPDLPIMADLPAEMVLNISEIGTYRIEVTVQPPNGEEISGSVEFYAVEAPVNRASDTFTTSVSSPPPSAPH